MKKPLVIAGRNRLGKGFFEESKAEFRRIGGLVGEALVKGWLVPGTDLGKVVDYYMHLVAKHGLKWGVEKIARKTAEYFRLEKAPHPVDA